jgi:hypothetical protein
MMDAATQAATWIIRRAARSRRYIGNLTPWRAGLVLHVGDFVQSGGLAWKVQTAGTTAGTAPNNTNGASFVDGGSVGFVHVALLTGPRPTI